MVKINKDLGQAERLKDKIEKALKTMEESGRGKVNLTDPDCAIMHSVQGSHASYNVQSVVDDKYGLVVHIDAVNDTSDVNQFAHQIEAANQRLGKRCEVGCADAGYADTEELKKIDEQGIKVVVPSQRRPRMLRRSLLASIDLATINRRTVMCVLREKRFIM